MVTESVVLALVGGGLGLAVAQSGIRALLAVSPPGLPRLDAIHLDPSAFAFAAVVSALVGLAVGIVPARGALREHVADGVRSGSTRTTGAGRRSRSVLVVAQVALALVLVVSAGLLFRSVRILMAIPPGFDPSHVVTMQVMEAGHAFDDPAARLAFYDNALQAVRRVPGVGDAAFTSQLPLSGDVDGYGFEVQARPDQQAGTAGSALRYTVSPDYFATMRIPLVRGRLLNAADRPGAAEAIVINESMARRLFGDQDGIGQRLRFGPQMGNGRWGEVVGVVGDVRHHSLAAAAPDAFYVANGQWEWADNVETLVVRASGNAASLVPELRQAVWSVNPDIPILRIQTMDGLVTASAGPRRFALLAIQTLAVVALLLAAIGLYGVIAGNVAERIREIGIRTALGASPGAVAGAVVRQALSLVAAGAVIGGAGAVVAARLLSAMLFQVSPLDPVTYGATAALLAVVALLAAWAPARRAVGVDPTVAVRAE
ncbi:MAG TPA: FtsX-like permease family protein [Gemmatimonadaceae bacterium]|nr:FtsX-like permease family protein [Gemmatimonadaceae bacterium]